MRGDELTMLQPWLAAFERQFGVAASVRPHPLAGKLSVGGLSCLRFPPVFERPELLGGVAHFAQSPTLAAHMRALGFDWDDDGRIRTMPTPETFNALLELATNGDAGYPLAVHRESATLTSTGPWLHRYLEGSIPVHIAPAEFYERAADDENLGWHLTTLAHDLSVHALNYHLIPRPEIREIGARIRAAASERLEGLDRDGAIAPLTLAWFFDNDLNRYCYEVWFRCTRAEHFAPTFAAPENLAQLHAALDTRIRETLAGLGDVATGRSEDLPPLEPVTFALRSVTSPTGGARQQSDR